MDLYTAPSPDEQDTAAPPVRRAREGLAEAFAALAGLPDDPDFDDLPVSLSRWDHEEWEWE